MSREHLDKARAELSALCSGRRFTMSIPAQPDCDSDLIIGQALRDMDKLLIERDALQAENKKLRELEMTAWGWIALADGHNEERAWVYRSCARAVLRALGIDTDGDLTETAYQKLDEHEAHDGRLLNL